MGQNIGMIIVIWAGLGSDTRAQIEPKHAEAELEPKLIRLVLHAWKGRDYFHQED